MGGRRPEQGVDLPQEDDARAGRSGELAVQREESLVRIAGEELPADPEVVGIGNQRACHTDQKERQPELPVGKGRQVDGSNGGYHHDIEHQAADTVEHKVVDIVPLHQPGLFEVTHDRLEQDGKAGAHKEVEAPEQRLYRVHRKAAQLIQQQGHGPHGPEGDQIDDEHQTHLHRQFIH